MHVVQKVSENEYSLEEVSLNGGMIENYTNGGMVKESRLMIFGLFSMLFYIK